MLRFPAVFPLERHALESRIQLLLERKTKPRGSLGRLEGVALAIATILNTETPSLILPQMLVCAGDHGIVTRGVSAFPSDVTWQMVQNFLSGGAAVSVLTRQHGIGLTVVDCGVRHCFEPQPGLLIRRIGDGTNDMLVGPAMNYAQCERAIFNGMEILSSLPGNALLLGEMGIGNTSSASLLMSRFTGLDIGLCTGAGTGLSADGVGAKVEILKRVLLRHPREQDPLLELANLGGFEIATLVGAILQAARENRVIVVDGFITSAAVLVANRIAKGVLDRCVFSHCSDERGHAAMLSEMGVQPILTLGLRLGEGSGAALAWPLLVSACKILCEMASFSAAGVSNEIR
jgi:nicotinate-nucleotide--dimethylbenzimidazole phosphoribosyltransferase